MNQRSGLTIGELAQRTGLAVSAIRYYEAQGLLHPWRNAGGQRRFERADIRRLSFVMIAQKFGFSLDRIRQEFDKLPRTRAPSKADWSRVSRAMQSELSARIAELQRMHDTLGGCIGCGCLSLDVCALYNRKDKAAGRGAGPRYLMGDMPRDIPESP